MLVLFPTLVSGEPVPVELELVLAIDTSVSVDSWEYRLQTGGLAAAFSTYVDKDGNISLPADFRKNMVHLGSWFVPEGEASGFHDVYSKPITVEAYRAAFAVG